MTAPTIAAMIGLLLVIPVAAALFATLTPTRAVLALTIGVVLFGPELADVVLPGLSGIDKGGLACICGFVGLCIACPERVRSARLLSGGGWIIIVMILGNVITDLVNRDVLVYGPLVIPGFSAHHFIRSTVSSLVTYALPFWIGRIAFRDREDGRQLIAGFIAFAVAYAPFVLIELRMSPQMHRWVYGYAQHAFIQTMRAGGYRPMVFMGHGLALAMFLFMASAMAWIAQKTKQKVLGYPALPYAIGLPVLLVFVKSLGALLFLGISLLLVLLTKPRLQLRVAVVISVLVVTYPVLRLTDKFPTTTLVDLSARYEKDRGGSLNFRFMNEDILLAKAIERPYFGWGGEGRGRVYDSYGRDACVTDGAWIIYLSSVGLVGYLSRFMLAIYPVWRASRRLGKVDPPLHPFISILALIVVFSAVDMIPNGMFNLVPMLLAGALSGFTDGGLRGGDSRHLLQIAALMWLRRHRASSGAAPTGPRGAAEPRRAMGLAKP